MIHELTAALCRPAKAGLCFSQSLASAYAPQQAKTGLAGDPGRAGLNNSALRAEANNC